MDGFGEELEGVAFGLGFTHELAGGGLSGEEEDAGGGKFLADFDAELDSGHFGHEDVAENDVGLDLAGGYESCLSAEGFDGVESMKIEDGGDGLGDEGFVVDNEDAETGAVGGLAGCLRLLGGRRGLAVGSEKFGRQKFGREEFGREE